MKISYKWLGEWVDLSGFKKPEDLADLLTARGLEVEGVDSLDKGLEKVIAVQIIEKEKHPEADRLSLCKVNTGQGEYLDIVCGAQNMKKGDIVCLAQVGANLPNGMKIEKGKIRGQVSMGMLCSEVELGLAKESEGILILPEKTPVGWKLADVLGIDDVVFEIKLTANRGDCLSHRGLAREIAAAIGKPLKTPKLPEVSFTGSPIKVELHAGDDAPQFFGVYMKGVTVGETPSWMKKRLETIGQRSINNLVDIGNYLMFEYGFPVHIYDADKLEGGKIQVRKSEKGELIPLLDKQDFETTGEELVIADGLKPVGLAGVMGGGNSEVTDATKNVFLECAEFNPTLVRRAAFRSGRRSEASLRFEKGIDPKGHREAITRLADLVTKLAGGEVVGGSFAETPARQNFKAKPITAGVQWINEFLGTAVPTEKMVEILKSVECEVTVSGDALTVIPPTYRLDLNIREDLAEEVARTIGYDAIPTTIPALSGMPKSRKDDARVHRLQVMDQIKDTLSELGLHEVLTYAFQSEAWIEKFGFKPTVKILNPLSEEQGYMVPSLLPGIMRAYQENERHHFGSEPLAVRMFEVRPVFEFKGEKIEAKSESDTGVVEKFRLSVLISGPRLDQAIKTERGEVDFFDLKGILETLFERLRTKGLRVRAADGALMAERSNLFHPGQAIQFGGGRDPLGFAGRIHPKLEAELKVRSPIYWAELELEPIFALTPAKEASFESWSTFPTMERDYALLLDESVPAENIIQSAIKNGKPIAKVVKIFDTYKGTHIPSGKISLGVRVIFSDAAKSLEEKQVDLTSETIVKKWTEEFGASLR
jgi:phenylalanyl-tRNA synthetase beta chain